MKPPLSFPTGTTLQNGALLEAEQNDAFLEAVQNGAFLEAVQNGALLEAAQNGALLKVVHSLQHGSLQFKNVIRFHGTKSM
jgi:hypothetical protein